MTQVKKQPTSIVERVMAFLNLTDEGKIQSFYERERRELEREIKARTRNKETLANENEDALYALREELQDAEEALSQSYVNVPPSEVATNAKQKEFSDLYWSRVRDAKRTVKNIKERILKQEESFENEIKSINAEIVELEDRLANIQ